MKKFALILAAVLVVGLAGIASAQRATQSDTSDIQIVPGLYTNSVQGPDFLMVTITTVLPEPIYIDGYGAEQIKVTKIVSDIRTDNGLVSTKGTGPVYLNGKRQVGETDWAYVEQSDLPQSVIDAMQAEYSADLASLQEAMSNPRKNLKF